MNLPNKLTLLRVCLIPFFLLFFYIDIPFHYLISLVVFAGASITDALDGNIARKRNLVTNFGKFLDPLADKVLVLSALAVFVEVPEIRVGAIPLIIISAREFMVSGLRLLAADSGIVVAAGIWGKLKTAFTMTAIVASLAWLSLRFDIGAGLPETLCSAVDNAVIPALIWISTILTVISGAIYLKGYWYLIDSDK
ncbi:CDP-diacylglycerol--glycerol-3-phosphate 3-phosphatidyltransferase [Ruminococcus sp. XPD3002]|jgi:CDP-diacylglycerol--glycerol-3-phosphate 3-phosphatidyltransferase|uniref:CDP-diacylglycerol--glycerol-3-phosphate 3-phosphatidyltransferase n=1 Tax=Ruminococcus sp. XPD3002 TaxID=1452269 RepID=UPI0009232D62|nr:CDP-diacylglycerol--glycerol-3-phosphate 3-phosphatidyltransferase [Ruminococcus sp.]SFX11027.1 CDP-diacylglycerol--glycerol-3-phosphate 3-phosphatidyltransferase [Ruminococcus flavefaciens]HRU96784.1 CDP-diacylglycerol--glycerol-3-phosphate 3-phosphatidyltransferase [Ruminococcus sp.]